MVDVLWVVDGPMKGGGVLWLVGQPQLSMNLTSGYKAGLISN